ncbi:uncharacterized protein C8R40DRAFT_739730 [Lentinula edodes]|uniref:uncharacterized protein n=1 Tax=Lentinula edodes TaxID=5353 RepID=UPI001E8CD26A|nr:uncharacterized protein C8R40DRAFT_739730 [Lentinula edodes]KAH7869539.1 hypothetical protein C8R40DRAFT_739730 [Lentinula edodes]
MTHCQCYWSYIMICCGNIVSHSLTPSFLLSLEIIRKFSLIILGLGQFCGTSYAIIFSTPFLQVACTRPNYPLPLHYNTLLIL